MTRIFFGPEIFFSGYGNRLPVVLVARTTVLHHLCDIWEGPGAQEHPTTSPDARDSSNLVRRFENVRADNLRLADVRSVGHCEIPPSAHLDLGMYVYSFGGRSTRALSPSQTELWGRIGAAGGREDNVIVAESYSC